MDTYDLMTDFYDSQVRLTLVEDDDELATLISDFLSKHRFDVTVISDGLTAVDHIVQSQPDIVILDIMLPGLSGMEVCKKVRQSFSGIILIQTALDDDIDHMMGLELGADDYIVKQVQPRLLLSRIRALLRRQKHYSQCRTSNVNANTIQAGDLQIDFAKRSVHMDSQHIDLTTAEFELLHLLALHSGQVVTRETILQEIKGYEYDGLDRTIDRRISRLRRKLSDDPERPNKIKTVRGKGYILCV